MRHASADLGGKTWKASPDPDFVTRKHGSWTWMKLHRAATVSGHGEECILPEASKPRILHTPVRFFPARGGVEKYVLELSKQLVSLGNNVTVVCADEPHAESCPVEGVKTIRLPYIAKVANTNITLRLFRHADVTELRRPAHTHSNSVERRYLCSRVTVEAEATICYLS